MQDEIKKPDEEIEETVVDDENETVDDSDDEFEYDDEGNIIIPDVTDDEDVESDEDAADDNDENSDDEQGDGSDDADKGDGESDAEPEESTDDTKDKRIAELENELKALKAQGRDTLKKLGAKETSDVQKGLEELAAEADDIPLEEYRKKKAESAESEEALRLLRETEFKKKMAADLAEVQGFYPETKGLKAITEISNFGVFAELRDKGLTPKQAYAAANPDGVRASVAKSVKQQLLNETKGHLRSAVPKGSKDNSITMSNKQLSEWRDVTDDEAVEYGEALVLASGKFTKCGATVKPTHIAMGSVAADATKRTLAAARVEDNQLYEVPVTAAPTGLTAGSKVTLHTDGLQVTATTTSGVVTVESLNGASAAGDIIVVRII